MEIFNVECPVCGIPSTQKCKTLSVALKRAAVSCSGIRMTTKGASLTRCATNYTSTTMDDVGG